ncbi:DMT family transporter [Halalkalibacter alkaliphilus]|uniref:DMT family transporter n=1 Tax=Halalkalibacter alkaliphilus TaxID=2917993 RepID=A0A9X2I6U8_9BACI|nr:DMT family transporter [Halalkalibacter alkaliphilus]MCL7749436.1 DMT family transporter [Halalkalibacter alkaliphilus]
MSKINAYFLVMVGASLWGLTGLFVQHLYSFEFIPWEVVGIRLIFSTLILGLFLLFYDRNLLKIKTQDIGFFIGTGIASIAFFNYCFFTTIEQANLSIAVVLLYTAPVFVTLISRILFKESLNINKVAALVVVIIGCSFTVGFYQPIV